MHAHIAGQRCSSISPKQHPHVNACTHITIYGHIQVNAAAAKREAALRAEMEELEKRRQESENRATDAEAQRREALSQLDALQQTLDSLRRELDEKNSAISTFKEQLESKENATDSLRQGLQRVHEQDSAIKTLEAEVLNKDKALSDLREEMQRREEDIALAAKARIDKVKENARAQLPSKIKEVVSRAYFELENRVQAQSSYQGQDVLALVLETLKSATLAEAGKPSSASSSKETGVQSTGAPQAEFGGRSEGLVARSALQQDTPENTELKDVKGDVKDVTGDVASVRMDVSSSASGENQGVDAEAASNAHDDGRNRSDGDVVVTAGQSPTEKGGDHASLEREMDKDSAQDSAGAMSPGDAGSSSEPALPDGIGEGGERDTAEVEREGEIDQVEEERASAASGAADVEGQTAVTSKKKSKKKK
jgi:hypothetical protein